MTYPPTKRHPTRAIPLAAALCLTATLGLTGAHASQSTYTHGQEFSATGMATEPVNAPSSASATVPHCAHDSTVWHGLVERDESGAILCSYGHEHKDDPHLADYVFGPPQYELSYPFQTPNENHLKHESYGYTVHLDLPPSATQGSRDVFGNEGIWYLRDLRIQSHLDMNPIGAPTRFHSAYIEARACRVANPDDCGVIRWGGHQDYGELGVDGVYVPTAQDDPGFTPATDASVTNRSHRSTSNLVDWEGRFHSTKGEPQSHITYGGFAHQTLDAWSYTSADDPARLVLTDPETMNNSTHRLTFFIIRNVERDAPASGRLTSTVYNYAKQLNLNPACTAPGPDCVPQVLEDWPILEVLNVNFRRAGIAEVREYDVKDPHTGRTLIQFPN